VPPSSDIHNDIVNSNRLTLPSRYIPVPVETVSEELLTMKVGNESPPSLVDNIYLTSDVFNLPVVHPPLKGGIDPPLPGGCRIPLISADQPRDPACQPDSPSRLIKTNYGDDVKSYNYAIHRFKEYIKKREDWYIQIHGRVKLTDTKFTYRKDDVHRWKDGYLKKRLARLYKLRDWFEKQPSQVVTMVTLTVPHNVNKWGKQVRTGHNIYEAWKNLKQGWTRLYQCKPGLFRDKEFVIIYEPHKTGYPHAHLMVFGSFTDDEVNRLHELWSEMTGADLLNGVDVRPGVVVRHVIAYLIKYTSKTLYHTMNEWTPGEWLFNAIAHEGRYRLFGSSNELSKIMSLSSDSDNTVETLNVSLNGLNPRDNDDSVLSSRLWTNPERKTKSPLMNNQLPIRPTSDLVARWKLKNNIVESEAEKAFKILQEKWRLHRLRNSKQGKVTA